MYKLCFIFPSVYLRQCACVPGSNYMCTNSSVNSSYSAQPTRYLPCDALFIALAKMAATIYSYASPCMLQLYIYHNQYSTLQHIYMYVTTHVTFLQCHLLYNLHKETCIRTHIHCLLPKYIVNRLYTADVMAPTGQLLLLAQRPSLQHTCESAGNKVTRVG